MDRAGDPPTPAEGSPDEGHEPTTASLGHSGSRWEPREDTDALGEQATSAISDTTGTEDTTSAHSTRGASDTTTTASVPAAGTTWWRGASTTSAAAPRRGRRGLRVAAGVGAAVLLAGGGFTAGHAVGDGGPDGGPGLVRLHGDHEGGPGGFGRQSSRAPTGQAPTGPNTSSSSDPILGGLST